ncbi:MULTISPECIES: signal peptidase II [Pseudanabaena]|uniref:Lipoprotein signal peptidase n=2 Tax=Pseudanabaena TaxID=1152 RepID=L8N0E2_9CYAN|nr:MULTISPECIES: signal peptidase II [Pseudanabaena]ELS32519.1 signal peptidase II [Pseudanabaena biceps PCC 7429]MDG3495255.1 signal peptidase II [Pseudanabaena catenata USMAC16]
MTSGKIENSLYWIAAILGLVLDQASKYLVVQYLKAGKSFPLIDGVVHFTYATNTGAAFSLFSGQIDWLKWVSMIVSLGLVAFGIFGKRLTRWEQVGYGCILAGAAGNGIDRFVAGYVVDFIDIRIIRFAIFNIADVSINVGLVCLAIAVLIAAKPSKSKK